MMRRLYLSCLFGLLISVVSVQAWGEVGHEIVATIAQTQLHPAVRQHLCDILPANRTSYISDYPRNQDPQKHCHLAPLAAWPDRVRRFYPWSSHLHYINPVDDEPPKHCTYGEYGWKDNGTGNVLEALVNYTSLVSTSQGQDRDIALRFLVHYMGDAHQPLHLTGRARGGNDIAVRFEGRYAKLHTVWDSLLINAQIRQLANYTTKLPSARIESALRGKSYDAYVRWILVEGLGQGKATGSKIEGSWWSEEQSQWTSCPAKSNQEAHVMVDRSTAHWLRPIAPQTSKLAERIFAMTFRPSARTTSTPDMNNVDESDLPVCPFAWTKPMHPLVCSYAFADPVPPIDGDHHGPLAELDVEQYKGRIEADKIIQKQLAKAGMRLAAVLNTLLLPEALAAQQLGESSKFSHVNTYTPTVISSKEESDKKKRKKRESRHGSTQSPIWSLIKVTAESIAEVILLSSVGYVLARQGVLDKKTQTRINKLNVSFFTPALLFSKVAFTLNPARLAELVIVPAGFVIITTVSFLSALLLSWMANLSKSQRNFSIACAITPNSNSLPVALMQSLVVTVPQLHWEEEGEPEDTPNGMLGRALTYLVLFSTLGMFLRWSVASQLLSTMDEEDEQPSESVPTARLIDHDDNQTTQDSAATHLNNGNPQITIRRSTEEGGQTEAAPPANFTGEGVNATPKRRPSRSRTGPPAWARSFPNTPGGSDFGDEEDEEETTSGIVVSVTKKIWEKGIKKPLQAVGRFMTMPLYAAVISLVVALIPPLQKVLGSIEPLVGALETAGACSIPLTMVVLGAYFYQEADTPTETSEVGDSARRLTASPPPQGDATHSHDREATLVGNTAEPKRKSMPWMRNPWKSSSTPSSRNGSIEYSVNGDSTDNGDVESRNNTLLNSSNESNSWWPSSRRQSVMSIAERKKKKQTTMERRTIAVAVASRMLLTPLILLPLAAYFALATIGNVMDDPVFITSACLLIGSPPALTLAQITSQSAKGSNSSFERLISKTIFTSYAILAAPSSILLVLCALLIAENDHS